MRKLISSLLCALGLSGCSGGHILTPQAYTRDFAAKLQASAPGYRVEVKRDLELRVIDSAGKEQTAFLDNSYAEYRLNPQNKDSIIARYASAFTAPGVAEGKVDKTRITPVIKDKAWIDEIRDAMKERGATKTPENVYEPFNDSLIIVYVEDNPTSVRYLTPKDVEDAGIRKEDLRGLAIDNLKRLLPEVEAHGGNGVFMLTAGGSYEASLLLLDGIWTNRQFQVTGDYVVAVPTRDVLLVTGTEDKEGVSKIRKMAADIAAKGPYRLTTELFVYRAGRFASFDK
ncbi:MAG TPA: DUF1444 family protein [Verrucomicrobiae bacterium]|nr:DUF1444 family protein [Verrucomicrobiae bacterium]